MGTGSERRTEILELLVDRKDGTVRTKRLCKVCAEVTAMSGAGIMLMSADIPHGSLCTTNRMSDLIEQLQYTLGEGPCVDAFRQNWPVLEPDLYNPGTPRWPAFSPSAIQGGARAVFGFPLQIGTVRLGALNLCRDRAGCLSDDQHADALILANIVAATVLVTQANAPPGKLADELEEAADFHYTVHQAAGMVAAQLDISVGQALIRLRAYAFGSSSSLTEVANNVVTRKLRLDAASSEKDSAQ
jgi:hypothetical protein